jgi:hypothetical protein
MLRREKHVTIINPGSCGQPRDYQPGACYGLLSVEDNQVDLKRKPYDLSSLLSNLRSMDYDHKLVDILTRTTQEEN